MIRILTTLAALLLAASAASAQVSPFVYDGGVLPTGKQDYIPQPAVPANKKVVASEWNGVMQDIYDLRQAHTGGLWSGYFVDQAPPAALDGGIAIFAMDGGAGAQPGLWYETPDAQLHQIGGGWTCYECDFDSQSTQNLGADATYTICGQTWQKYNTANEQAAMDVLPDAGGLFCQAKASPTSTSFTALTSRTGPVINMRLQDALPAFSLTSPVKVEFYDASPSAPTATQQLTMVGLDQPDGGNGTVGRIFRGWEGTAAGFQLGYWQEASGTIANNQTGVPAYTNNVVEGVWMTGLQGGVNGGFAGAYGTSWPDDSAMLHFGTVSANQSTFNGPPQTQANQITLSVGCQNGTAASAYISIVRRVRVCVKN